MGALGVGLAAADPRATYHTAKGATACLAWGADMNPRFSPGPTGVSFHCVSQKEEDGIERRGRTRKRLHWPQSLEFGGGIAGKRITFSTDYGGL